MQVEIVWKLEMCFMSQCLKPKRKLVFSNFPNAAGLPYTNTSRRFSDFTCKRRVSLVCINKQKPDGYNMILFLSSIC